MFCSHVIINGLMKEVVMCNKKWRLKSPLKVNRPLDFLLKHRNFDFALFRGGGNYLNLIFRRVTKILNIALKIKGGGREGGRREVL